MNSSRVTLATQISVTVAITIAICAAQATPQRSSCRTFAQEASADPLKERAAPQLGSQRYPRYELRAGDVLDISFEFTPEFNQTVAVQPDGYITLRQLGDVYVGGMTVPKLTETIRTAYGKILNNPAVAVVLKDFEKPYFIASGEIARPGKYELRGDTTVIEAIAMAGGLLNKSAKPSQVVLYRRVSQDKMEGRILNVKKMIHDKNLSEDLHVKPGDMVIVPQNRLSKIERFLPIPNTGINMSPPIP